MSLIIATPVYGNGPHKSAQVSLGYHEGILNLKQPGVELLDSRVFTDTDLVRARSRALALAYEGGFDHLLFWDSDVQAPSQQLGVCIQGMIESGYDLVGAPYPKKRIHWNKIADALANGMPPTADNLESAAYEWPIHGFDMGAMDDKHCVPCRYLPMGFTLISRKCMQDMIESPNNKHLTFKDFFDGKHREIVAAFALLINSDGLLLSEDGSFCERYSHIGGQAKLYVGPGSALQHVGAHTFGVK